MRAPRIEFSLDPKQALEDHHCNPMKNAFLARVILGAANVLFDYDSNEPRSIPIATIADQDNPLNSGVCVFGTQQEHDSYVEACYSATETGWAVHVANGCEQNYLQNMRNYLATRDHEVHDHDIRSLQDHVYWYKHHMQKQAISKSYQKEIQTMEAVRGNVITFLRGVIAIGAERRALLTLSQRPQPPKITIPQITAFQWEQTGRPDPNSDVFFLFTEEPTRNSATRSMVFATSR